MSSYQTDTNRDSHPTQQATLYQYPHTQQHINHNSAQFHMPTRAGSTTMATSFCVSNLCENTNLSVDYQQNQQYPIHTQMAVEQVAVSSIAATSIYPSHQCHNNQASTYNVSTHLYNTPTPPYPSQPDRHNHPYVSR